MSNIRVEYDGCYPNTCSGTLKIFENETEIYSNDFVCHSTGNVCSDTIKHYVENQKTRY